VAEATVAFNMKDLPEVKALVDDLARQLTAARATNTRLNRRCQEVESALGDKLTRIGLFHAGLDMYARQRDEARDERDQMLTEREQIAGAVRVLVKALEGVVRYVDGGAVFGYQSTTVVFSRVWMNELKTALAHPALAPFRETR
jgi:hypothetical protein